MERRQARRSPLSSRVTYAVSAQLSSRGSHKNNKEAPTITAQIRNVSEGGICLLTKRPLTSSQIVRLGLPLPRVAITTPTMAEVRWVKKELGKGLYQTGLRFLL